MELGEAKSARVGLNNYLALNSIFMTGSLREQFREINNAFANVISSEKTTHTSGHNEIIQKSRGQSLSRISDLFEKIGMEVQKRLRYDEA